MKKIINNKRYDTETAKKLGEDDAPCSVNDFNYWRETLYQKRTGEFFLHGEGHGMSRYAERYVDGWGWGEKIIPMSFSEARDWAEKHLEADQYEGIFGPVEEDDSRRLISLSIPVSAAETLKRLAAESGKSQSEIVTEMILGS